MKIYVTWQQTSMGGQPSKAVKEIIFRNMMKIVLNEFNK